MGAYGDKLVADIERLQKLTTGLTYKPTELANGAQSLLDEVASSKITGEEERYSHIDLLDFANNDEGAEQAFAQLQPALQKIDPALTSTIAAQFAALDKLVESYRTTSNPSGYKLYTELTDGGQEGARRGRQGRAGAVVEGGEQGGERMNRHMEVGKCVAAGKPPTVPGRRNRCRRRRGRGRRRLRRRPGDRAGRVGRAAGRAGLGAVLRHAPGRYRYAGPGSARVRRPSRSPVRMRDAVARLLGTWAAAAAQMTKGLPVGVVENAPQLPPIDTGEAVGLGAANLTITVGFGPSLFDDRFGLAAKRPAALEPLPALPGDYLDPDRSGGDLCVQACADDPTVAFHAIRNFARLARGVAVLKWSQLGFGRTSSTSTKQETARNLMGFKDGTRNIKEESAADFDEFVWVGSETDQDWMKGGSYLVARRIRMLIESWDTDFLADQETVFGRFKTSGAPLTGNDEFDTPDLSAKKTGRVGHRHERAHPARVAGLERRPEDPAARLLLHRRHRPDDGAARCRACSSSRSSRTHASSSSRSSASSAGTTCSTSTSGTPAAPSSPSARPVRRRRLVGKAAVHLTGLGECRHGLCA